MAITNPNYVVTVNGLSRFKNNLFVAQTVSVTGNLANQTCPVTLKDGGQCTVLYVNGGSAAYTVSISTTYKSPDGNQVTVTVPVGGYAEVNFLKVGSMTFVRGV